MMGHTFGLGLFTGQKMTAHVAGPPSEATATVTLSISPQDGDNIAVSYTVTAETTCEVVLYEAAQDVPTVPSFAGGGAPVYIDLGSVALTPDGVGITLDLPDDLDGLYKIALLPAGGGDGDVVESSAVTLDTSTPVLIAVTQVLEARAKTGYGGGKSFFGGVDLSAYPAGTDILVLQRDANASSASIDGVSATHLTSGSTYSGGIYAHAFVATLTAQGTASASLWVGGTSNMASQTASVYAIENGVIDQVNGGGASASTGADLTVTPTHANNVILALSTANSGAITTDWSSNMTETFDGVSGVRTMSLARADGVPVAAFNATTTLSSAADWGAVLVSISEAT